MFFLIVLLIAIIGPIATDLYLPSLPFIMKEFGATQNEVQLTLTSYLLSFALSQSYYGPLSEKIGRKKTILYGLILMLIGSIFCIFSKDIFSLTIGRFIEGMGVGSSAAVFRAILRDAYSGNDLSQRGSYISIGISFCIAAAPTLGGYIQSILGWRFNFIFIAIYTVLVFLFVLIFFQETNLLFNPKATRPKELIAKYRVLLKSPIFIGYVGCAMMSFAGIGAYLATSPFLFQVILNLSPIAYGWLAIFIAIGLFIGGVFNALFIKKLGKEKMLQLGVFLQTLSGIVMLLPALFGQISIFLIMIPMLLYMIGTAFVFANAFAGAFHFFAKVAGFAGALYGTFQTLGGTLSAGIMSSIYISDQIPLALSLTVVGALGFFLQKLAIKAENHLLEGMSQQEE